MTTYSQFLEYDSGDLIWKVDRGSQLVKGKVAGSLHDGYVRVRLAEMGGRLFAHNIIWQMFNGSIPEDMYVDHINGNRSDNRIENLRLVTKSQNGQNQKLHSNNTSGCKNVSWHSGRNKWVVSIQVDNKRKQIGYFDDLELADLVAQEARNKYHGVYANHC